MINLCSDCKWCKLPWFDRFLGNYMFAKCVRPGIEKNARIDPVNGFVYQDTSCSTERTDSPIRCGYTGNYFEQK